MFEKPREVATSGPSDALLDAVFRLSETERAALSARLIESLDPSSDPIAETAWSDEIAQRLSDLDAGRVRTVPRETARRQIEADGDDDAETG